MRLFTFALLVVVLQDESRLALKEGRTWSYAVTKSSIVGGLKVKKEGTASLTVKSKVKIDDVEFWVLEWKEAVGKDNETATIWVREDGDKVVVVKTDSDHCPILPADFKEKKSKAKVKSAKAEIEVETTVGDEEELETPAGKFKAVKVTSTSSVNVVKATTIAWYVKGTGIVKVVRTADVAGVKAEKEFVLRK
jgi:hypothetical protein